MPKKGYKQTEEHRINISKGNKGRIVTNETRIKISKKHKNKKLSEEHKQKLADSHLGEKHSEEHKRKISESNKGRIVTEETRDKISKANSGSNNGRFGVPPPNKGKHISEETRNKLMKYTGSKSSNWKGGTSFEPYCEKFNNQKREEIRNQYSRKCYICNIEEKTQMELQKLNGKRPFRLSVHHTNWDKKQGCNGKDWKLVPLCIHCHNSNKMEILK